MNDGLKPLARFVSSIVIHNNMTVDQHRALRRNRAMTSEDSRDTLISLSATWSLIEPTLTISNDSAREAARMILHVCGTG
jgi:hypothetical protein